MSPTARTPLERYQGRETPHPALPAIGRNGEGRARPGLALHRHRVHEICLLEQGAVDWHVDGQDVRVTAGQVFFTRPGERHGSVSGMFTPCVLSWLQVDVSHLADPLCTRLLGTVRGRVWQEDGRLLALHGELLGECRDAPPDAGARVKTLLTDFIIVLARQARSAAGQPGRPPGLQRVLAAVEGNPVHPWRVDEMAGIAGIGTSRLYAMFREHLGTSPAAWALQVRLRHAAGRLRTGGDSILAIALAHGFSSSQHFATAFRRQFGMTARAYRETPGL